MILSPAFSPMQRGFLSLVNTTKWNYLLPGAYFRRSTITVQFGLRFLFYLCITLLCKITETYVHISTYMLGVCCTWRLHWRLFRRTRVSLAHIHKVQSLHGSYISERNIPYFLDQKTPGQTFHKYGSRIETDIVAFPSPTENRET